MAFKRRLSDEEMRGHYILVSKKDLDYFPKIGRDFKLKVNDKEYETRVETEERWVTGPRKPQLLYLIKFTDFQSDFDFHYSKLITIEKTGDKLYELK